MKNTKIEGLKELNWYERFIVKIHKRLFKKIYSIGVKKGFNWSSNF